VRRCQKAMDYMDAHLAESVSLADLAHAAGVSALTLEQSFHLHLRKPLMMILREKRLDRIHHELMHFFRYKNQHSGI